jgi:apolipoprotein N-acyltransferase
MKLPKVENLGFIGIIVVAVLVFFYFILGFSGMMSALGIILLFIVPAYWILDNFNLSQDEKLVFSFFIGVGIFPAISYWLGMVISFRIAIFVTFVVLLAVGFWVRKYVKK